MIHVENVSKRFGSKQVLFDINFKVNKGEILGFLGPNAAGKTTTMRIITCFLPANEGTVKVAGYDVLEQSMEVRRNIGYMPESPPIYPEMSVKSYLDFVSRIKGIRGKDIKKRIDEVMELVNITHVRDRICGRLSKGYRQRVGLAQALIHNPPILILDEPTSGLDPKQIIEVRELIKSLAGDHTIILSTHILPEVKLTCDRIVIIHQGRIVAEGTEENLTQKIKGSEKLYIEAGGTPEQIVKSLNNIPGVIKVDPQKLNVNGHFKCIVEISSDKDIRHKISSALTENNLDLYELKTLGMTLEEIFLQFTSGEAIQEN